jgi:hypothetical protein
VKIVKTHRFKNHLQSPCLRGLNGESELTSIKTSIHIIQICDFKWNDEKPWDGFWGIQHFQTNPYSVVPWANFAESFVTQVETTEDPPEAPVDEAISRTVTHQEMYILKHVCVQDRSFPNSTATDFGCLERHLLVSCPTCQTLKALPGSGVRPPCHFRKFREDLTWTMMQTPVNPCQPH